MSPKIQRESRCEAAPPPSKSGLARRFHPNAFSWVSSWVDGRDSAPWRREQHGGGTGGEGVLSCAHLPALTAAVALLMSLWSRPVCG